MPATPSHRPEVTPATPRIALLLPLSGAQRAVAEAVRDGFIAAWLADDGPARAPVMVLDEEQGGAVGTYRQALDAGAGIVVGPLLKESAAQIATVAGTVPTLVLNTLDAATPPPPGPFFQFALAPEDEARQVAERAVAEGRRRALALVPDSEWGRRLLASFTPALEAIGGTVLAHHYYDPAATDFTAAIERLLHLDESRDRHRRLVANLGVALEFEPRRRDDIDFIFMAASTATGRLIRPQLRFLDAGDIPTYATSVIYQAGSGSDADLDGVMFADAPVLVAPDEHGRAMQAAVTARWPAGAMARLRFFALGYDAYGLAASLAAAPGVPAGLAGLSGMLSFDTAGRVHRQLPWAQFHDGRIVLLGHTGNALPP